MAFSSRLRRVHGTVLPGTGLCRSSGDEFHLQKLSSSASLVTEREGDVVTVATPAGRCFFLRNDNLCQIELDHGRARKPGICLLFPFNDFSGSATRWSSRRTSCVPSGSTFRPHPERSKDSCQRREAIQETAMGEADYVRGFVGTAKLPTGRTAQEILQRERSFRICAAKPRPGEIPRCRGGELPSPAELRSFRKRVAKLLSWSMPAQTEDRDGIDDILIASASAYRLESLYHTDEGLLRFLTLAELMARRVYQMSLSPATLQGVYGVIEDMRPALRLLAWDDEQPPLKKVVLKTPEFGDTKLMASAQKFLNLMPSRGVIPALEKAFGPKFTADERMVIVRQSADVVDPAVKRTA
jgi:hypothetical protein